jgi:RsiW-degrading membrane proteinase PrsW (M82 family)
MPEIAIPGRPVNSASFTVAGRQIPIRVCLFWAGLTIWLGNTVIQTGSSGFAALFASLTFVFEIALITSFTRTISLDRVASTYCLGGAMAAVMWVVAYAFTSVEPNVDAVSRQFFVPFMEELLKVAPVLFILWRFGESRRSSVGASDVLLLAAASGGGFGVVEEAYIRQSLHSVQSLAWLPITRINGETLTAGHGVWTTLAGATLGLALLWRPRKPLNYLLASSGLFWSILDHSHHNYGVDRSGFSVDSFNFITGHGWFSLYFFILGVIAVIGTDAYAVRAMVSSHPQLKLHGFKPPANRREGSPLKVLWAFLLERRAFAYVLFRCQRSQGAMREKLQKLAAVLGRRLMRPSPVLVSPKKSDAAVTQ